MVRLLIKNFTAFKLNFKIRKIQLEDWIYWVLLWKLVLLKEIARIPIATNVESEMKLNSITITLSLSKLYWSSHSYKTVTSN